MDYGQSKEESNTKMQTMKELLKQLFDDDIDGVSFIPDERNVDDLCIRSFTYKRRGKVQTQELGDTYHILIYKQDSENNVAHSDNFTAILTDPHEYANWIINCGFYGIISKKTKSSTKFVNDIYKKIKIYA